MTTNISQAALRHAALALWLEFKKVGDFDYEFFTGDDRRQLWALGVKKQIQLFKITLEQAILTLANETDSFDSPMPLKWEVRLNYIICRFNPHLKFK